MRGRPNTAPKKAHKKWAELSWGKKARRDACIGTQFAENEAKVMEPHSGSITFGLTAKMQIISLSSFR